MKGFHLSAAPALASAMHLYLHVPFCARRCSYCDFAIAVRRETPSEEYVDRVLIEWEGWLRDPRWLGFARLTTLYLGGGTPSRLGSAALKRLIDRLTADRPLAPGAEVTIEANPEDVTAEAARAWRAAGINRVSLGVQSFDPAVLTWMHRTHTVEQVPRAMAALREAGFENVSLDLIYSLPASVSRDWSRDLDQALALAPEHLSVYGLTVEPKTPLGRWVARGETRPAPDDRYAEEFLLADQRMRAAGFRHYEVSNYSLPGKEAVHNRAYWRRAAFLGLGPSAHSGIGSERWWNLRDWTEWSRALSGGLSAVAEREELSPALVAMEELYLGLRSDEGVSADRVGIAARDAWVAEGWAMLDEGRLRLSPEGWLRLDALVSAAT